MCKDWTYLVVFHFDVMNFLADDEKTKDWKCRGRIAYEKLYSILLLASHVLVNVQCAD